MPDDNNKTPTNENLTVGPPLNDPGNTDSSLANDNNQPQPPTNTNAEDELKAAQDAIKTSAPSSSQEVPKETNESQKPNMPKSPKPVVEETSGSFPPVSTESTEAPPPPPFPTEQQSGIPVPPEDETEEPKDESVPEQTNQTPPPPPPPGMPPVVTPPKPKKKFGGKKLVATILGLLLLVGGVGAGVVLVQNNQDIRNRAYAPEGANCRSNSDCGSGEVCQSGDCVRGTAPKTPTPTDNGSKDNKKDGKTTTKGKAGDSCTSDSACDTGLVCLNGQCQEKVGNGCPINWTCDKVYTEGEKCTDVWPGSIQQSCKLMATSANYTGTCCIPPGTSSADQCTDDSQCSSGQVCMNGKCVTTTTTPGSSLPSPTPPSGSLTAQCLDIQVYDTSWNQLTGTQLSNLKAGDKIRLVVGGSASSGTLDKARFTVNGIVRPAVTTTVRQQNYPTFKAPSTSTINYYDEYTIPDGITSFSVQAELHHSTLGWFGK
jgi:Cys-rich repeat protein